MLFYLLMLTVTVLMLTMSVLMLPVTVLMLPVWPEFHNQQPWPTLHACNTCASDRLTSLQRCRREHGLRTETIFTKLRQSSLSSIGSTVRLKASNCSYSVFITVFSLKVNCYEYCNLSQMNCSASFAFTPGAHIWPLIKTVNPCVGIDLRQNSTGCYSHHLCGTLGSLHWDGN